VRAGRPQRIPGGLRMIDGRFVEAFISPFHVGYGGRALCGAALPETYLVSANAAGHVGSSG